MKTVVNVKLAEVKAQYSVAAAAYQAAVNAANAAEAAILLLLSKLLNGNPGAKEALVAMGHENPKAQVRFLTSFCLFVTDRAAHDERLRLLAFINAFGQIKDCPVQAQEKMISAMCRGEGRKALESFIKNGIRPLDDAVSEFIRAERNKETAHRNLILAKGQMNSEKSKIRR